MQDRGPWRFPGSSWDSSRGHIRKWPPVSRLVPPFKHQGAMGFVPCAAMKPDRTAAPALPATPLSRDIERVNDLLGPIFLDTKEPVERIRGLLHLTVDEGEQADFVDSLLANTLV